MSNRITINWSNFSQEITDINGLNKRTITWNVPHAIYKDVEPLVIGEFYSPHAIIEENEFQYVDNEIAFDQKYYYRLGELRPGGEFFSEQVSIEIKHLILKYEAPFLAEIEYKENPRLDDAGNVIPYTELNLNRVDEDGNKIEVIKPEWFWEGQGRISEWLEFIVNDETIAIRERGTYSQSLKTIVENKDRRNYPAGKVDGDMPVTTRGFYLGQNNIVEAPYWWAEWHHEVSTESPNSWHQFWESRFSGWDDTQDWYDEDWTLDKRTVPYSERPYINMHGPYNPVPLENPLGDLVLRAKVGSSLPSASYTGLVPDKDTGVPSLVHNYAGIPRPGTSIGLGLGPTVTFSNIRPHLRDTSHLRFVYNGVEYTTTFNGIEDINLSDIDMVEAKIQELINNEINENTNENDPEPHITVSFGPRFDVL